VASACILGAVRSRDTSTMPQSVQGTINSAGTLLTGGDGKTYRVGLGSGQLVRILEAPRRPK